VVWIKSVVEINTSPAKKSISGQRIPVKETHPNGNGKPYANGNGHRHQNGFNGNGTPVGARYSERVLSNFYLASYVFYSFIRAWDGNDTPELTLKTRVMLRIKRILDVTLSSIGLVLFLPIFLILAVLVKLDSEGPVLYRQERIGQNRRQGDRRRFALDRATDRRTNRDRRREDYFGGPFVVHKFRTMHKDAEKKCGPIWATKDDPRVTRFGRLLRKARLDELPQLWNVLNGDMSLVGPRPERLHFVRKLAPQVRNYTKRLTFKPGITGLAQVEKGYDSSVGDVNKKLRYDLLYINNWSLGRDIRILLKTTLVMITGKGAF
jgi:lipopolysaccharide/colanic/teichoic acid biosynthesis glycosyltransferase